MSGYLNYMVEANAGLLFFLLVYKVLLGSETNFHLLRILLLTGIFASLLFPLIHLENNQGTAPLSIGRVIPSYWLPEVVVGEGAAAKGGNEVSFNFWKYTFAIYSLGFAACCLLMILRLVQLFRIIHRSRTYRFQTLRIAESREDTLTFSFFRFIFIGKADELSQDEKAQIIRHERVHAQQWHSFDILLMHVLKAVFWFNPFINTYKKIFIQLHEFEADARAVETSDLNRYCSLLAKVALQSADLALANHFNNSLTVKRIEMMRTVKSNISRWKLVAVAAMVPVAFFLIACQDQVGDDIMKIARNSSHALVVPEQIQKTFEKLQAENPDKKYALLELNETASEKLDNLQKQYGLPKSLTVFKTENGSIVQDGVMRGESENALLLQKVVLAGPGEHQTFLVLEYNEETSKIAEASQEDRIFTVVEEAPEFPGGYDSMMVFIKENLRYPLEARLKGVEGTVYVSFVVGKNGTVSDAHIIRGISPDADQEALRVVQLSPPWIPGKQNREAVSVRFVLPIKFKLNN